MLGNFVRTLAAPETIRSLTSLKAKLIKIGGKLVRYGRYVTPDGRGRYSTGTVHPDFGPDRRAAAAAATSAGMNGSIVMSFLKNRGRGVS